MFALSSTKMLAVITPKSRKNTPMSRKVSHSRLHNQAIRWRRIVAPGMMSVFRCGAGRCSELRRNLRLEWDLLCLAGKAVDSDRQWPFARSPVVNNDALDRIDCRVPGLALQDASRCFVSRFPARANTCRSEVDVLGVVLAVEPGSHEPHDVHGGAAPPGRELAHFVGASRAFRHVLGKLADDVTQMMDLLLAGDVALGATCVLNVLVPSHHLPERLRFSALG